MHDSYLKLTLQWTHSFVKWWIQWMLYVLSMAVCTLVCQVVTGYTVHKDKNITVYRLVHNRKQLPALNFQTKHMEESIKEQFSV